MNRDSHPGRARLQLAVSTWLVHAWSGVQESNLHLEGQSLASSPLDTTPIGANTGNRTRIPAIPARCTAVVRCRRGRAGCPTSWRGSESNRPQSHCKCDSPPWNMPPRGAAVRETNPSARDRQSPRDSSRVTQRTLAARSAQTAERESNDGLVRDQGIEPCTASL
jgi:hypothetical protein